VRLGNEVGKLEGVVGAVFGIAYARAVRWFVGSDCCFGGVLVVVLVVFIVKNDNVVLER
jgi:hypothetical protein